MSVDNIATLKAHRGDVPVHRRVRFPTVAWKELQPLLDEHATYLQQIEDVYSRWPELQAARATGVTAHQRDLADAIRAGKRAPAADKVASIDEQLNQLVDREEALDLALAESVEAIKRTMDEHREAWAGDLQSQVERARRACETAIDKLERARASYDEALGIQRWFDGFPDAPYVPATRTVRLRGDRLSAEQLFAALRADAEPPSRRGGFAVLGQEPYPFGPEPIPATPPEAS